MKTLRDRFRDFRRKRSQNSSDVKVEYSFKAAGKPGPKTKKAKLAEPPFPPPGEDTVSFARRNQRLKAESVKSNLNRGIVSELMKVTYAMRRYDITHNSRKLKVILVDYPFLKSPEEASVMHFIK